MNYQICFPQMTPPFYLQDQLNVNQILMISEWTMGHSSGFKYHLYSNILVQPGCYNKISQIRLLISNRTLFLTVLEAGKSKVNGQWVQCLDLLPDSQITVLGGMFSSHSGRDESSLNVFHKDTNPIHEGSTLTISNHLLKTLTPNIITPGIKFQCVNLRMTHSFIIQQCRF